jgi:hypothetical protein
MVYCRVCGNPLPIERLEALPNTTTCVDHSDATPKVGFMVYGHKTAGECILIDPRDQEALRRAHRANSRSR